MRFWWILMIFSRVLEVFKYILLFSSHAFFDGIHVIDVILRIVDCFWWFFHVFFTIFKGFERFSVHFEGFLLCLMVFDVFSTVFYDFYRIFDEFSCFLYYFWRLWTHFWRPVLFFEIFFVGFTGLAGFWRI